MTTLAEQLAAAEERVEQLRARQRDREARARKQQDARRNRAMVLWGVSDEYGIKHAQSADQRARLIADMRARIEVAWAGRNRRDRDAAIAYLEGLIASLPPLDTPAESTPITHTIAPKVSADDGGMGQALRDDFADRQKSLDDD